MKKIKIFSWTLGAILSLAGVGHLSFQREDFKAQVPDYIPFSKDLVVLMSGVVEIGLGISLLFMKSKKIIGIIVALFFVAVFPGNIHQYVNKTEFGILNNDRNRLIRLFFQPVLVLWALMASKEK